MGGFFNFLTTIATNGRGRPFDTFLALTSYLAGIHEDARRAYVRRVPLAGC
jgi:hypothetical protein